MSAPIRWACSARSTFDLTPRLSATAGLRYSREHKTIDNAGQLSTLDPPIAVVPGSAYAYSDAIAHTAWTPKFGLDFRARDRLFTYASATRGFKSGGFNFTSPEAGRGYAPEWAWSYEGGLKTTVDGGRATINAAVFHTDYTDLQVQTAIRPGVIDISNAADATIRGVELEGATRAHGPPPRRRTHRVAGGHLRSLHRRRVGGITGDVAGNRLTNAPRGQGGVAAVERQRRPRRPGLAARRRDLAEHGLLHAVQRQHPASALVWPARRQW